MKEKNSKNEIGYMDFLHGNGEMANLIRQKNWNNTVVGHPNTWPKSLCNTLNIILDTKFPMFIFWGDDLVCFYNDAYRPSLGNDGKHPHILGEKGKDSWEEIWDIIFPLLDNVRETGESYWSEDQLVPIYRNGKIEYVYWTFSYSAIRTKNQKIGGILVTCNETTQKVKYLNKLKESEDQFRFALEAAELGSWDYDPIKGKFTANNLLKEWFGLQNEEYIDLNTAINCIAEDDRERVMANIDLALNSSNHGSYDEQYTVINRLTGNKIIVRAKGKAWHKDGKTIRFNGILQDVTIQVNEHSKFLKDTNDTLQKYIVQLKKSNEELQSFAYVSSHDLQEPLRKITTFISRIEERENLVDRDASDFNRITKSAKRMRQLITDLLDYSKIDQTQLQKENVEVVKLINETLEDFSEVLLTNETEITIAELPSLDVIPYQFKQLFSNLINNAIKFAKKEQPLEIKITGEKVENLHAIISQADPSKIYYKITFQDNGIGFDQKQNERIFEVFQKLHSKSDYLGTGIGLSIVKKIMAEHSGYIKAKGEEGVGAKFDMFFPYNSISEKL